MFPPMRIPLLAVLLSLPAPLLAGEADAGHAPPGRWPHPRGPASASGRSLAEPPTSFGGLLWSYSARSPIRETPLLWDGALFLLEDREVVVLDAATGRVRARAALPPAPTGTPALHEQSIFLIDGGTRLVEFHLRVRQLQQRWSCDVGGGAAGVRIHMGEIYVTTAAGLLRLRQGRGKPAWSAAGRYEGEPAVLGDHVYALRRPAAGGLQLVIHERRDGKECGVAERGNEGGAGGVVAVSEGMAAVQVGGKWALLARNPTPSLRLLRLESLKTPPLLGPALAIALSDSDAWTLYMDGKRPVQPVLPSKSRPDLGMSVVAPTGLGEVICFGAWAGDLNANEVLWHLRERSDVKQFAKGVAFAPVPSGDGRMVAVPEDRRSVHCIGPEEIGS